MAKVAYYPGCALEGSGGPYDRSTRALVKSLGLEMETLQDWNCCGAMEVKNIHPMLQTYMSARNMAIASEQMGYDTVMAPCNGCSHNLKKAEYELGVSGLAGADPFAEPRKKPYPVPPLPINPQGAIRVLERERARENDAGMQSSGRDQIDGRDEIERMLVDERAVDAQPLANDARRVEGHGLVAEADEHDRCPRSGHCDRRGQGTGCPRCLKDAVRRRTLRRLDGGRPGAQLPRDREPLRLWVHHMRS